MKTRTLEMRPTQEGKTHRGAAKQRRFGWRTSLFESLSAGSAGFASVLMKAELVEEHAITPLRICEQLVVRDDFDKSISCR